MNDQNKKIFPIPDEPIIHTQYRSIVDDRKAKVGSMTDFQRLRQFGFKKFRYLSDNFVREQLVQTDESVDSFNRKTSLLPKDKTKSIKTKTKTKKL
jgi:hypothetical protein